MILLMNLTKSNAMQKCKSNHTKFLYWFTPQSYIQ